jgi:hypothetical protein
VCVCVRVNMFHIEVYLFEERQRNKKEKKKVFERHQWSNVFFFLVDYLIIKMNSFTTDFINSLINSEIK